MLVASYHRVIGVTGNMGMKIATKTNVRTTQAVVFPKPRLLARLVEKSLRLYLSNPWGSRVLSQGLAQWHDFNGVV